MTIYYVVFVGKKIEILTFCLNITKRCHFIKVIYTKLIIIEMGQCENVCYIHKDGGDLMDDKLERVI